MPSREVVLIPDPIDADGDNAPRTASAANESNTITETASSKITPVTAEKKQADSTAVKKKSKQQTSLLGFFGTAKIGSPSTPHASSSSTTKVTKGSAKEKLAPGAQKSTKKVPVKSNKNLKNTTSNKKKATATKPNSEKDSTDNDKANNISSNNEQATDTGKLRRNKMDFKDVIVGNLSSRKPASIIGEGVEKENSTPNNTSTIRSGPDVDFIKTGSDRVTLDSIMPRIPSLGSVPRATLVKMPSPSAKSSVVLAVQNNSAMSSCKDDNKLEDNGTSAVPAAADPGIQSVSSQNESEAGISSVCEMKDVKSQLLPIFENPPTTATGKQDCMDIDRDLNEQSIDDNSHDCNRNNKVVETSAASAIEMDDAVAHDVTMGEITAGARDAKTYTSTISFENVEVEEVEQDGFENEHITTPVDANDGETPDKNDLSKNKEGTCRTEHDQIEHERKITFVDTNDTETADKSNISKNEDGTRRTELCERSNNVLSNTDKKLPSQNNNAKDSSSMNVVGDEAASSATCNADTQALLVKHETMRVKYCGQAAKLLAKARNGAEEDFDISLEMLPTEDIDVSSASDSDFPDYAVPHLISILEGSNLPLSSLANHACSELIAAFKGANFSVDAISAKIKLLASRKAYIKNPTIAFGTTVSNILRKDINVFEDTDIDHMWRWEAVSLDLLSEGAVKEAKKARSARRKLQLHFNATAKLLGALDESIKLLQGPPGLTDTPREAPSKENLEKAVGKISREEEKVLKFEQDAEKSRLLAEAKKQKETAIQQGKDRATEEKKRAAEERKRGKEEAKQRKAREREEAKRQKEEKSRAEGEKRRAEQERKDKERDRQKKRMMSFFGGVAKKAENGDDAKSYLATEKESLKYMEYAGAEASNRFDSIRFRSCLDSQSCIESVPFKSLSTRAIASRRPKSKRVKMRVFVLGQNADDPFAAQPAFSEERIVEVRNRNKFFRFQEDYRPPYHGTWSKYSAFQNLGKKPFSKEPSLNYDVDSEEEWEEGDDEMGEDVENDAGDDEDEKLVDEEGDTRAYNYGDGWLAEDDADLGVEDADTDEETKKLLKKSRKEADNILIPVCIIAPGEDGTPIVEKYGIGDPALQRKIEGLPVEDAYNIVSCHGGHVLVDTNFYLDAFPPPLVEEREGTSQPSTSPSGSGEPSSDDMQIIAKFIHHSNHMSKSQVVERLREAHPLVTASRAQAHRVLDSVAEKKRHPETGVYWEVKQNVIENLGLSDELKPMELPEEAPKKRKRKNSEESESEPKAKKANEVVDKTPSKSKDAPKAKGSEKPKKKASAASVALLAKFLKKN